MHYQQYARFLPLALAAIAGACSRDRISVQAGNEMHVAVAQAFPATQDTLDADTLRYNTIMQHLLHGQPAEKWPTSRLAQLPGALSPYHRIVAYFTGFKLFYQNDVNTGGHLMQPDEVLRLFPSPVYIQYQ